MSEKSSPDFKDCTSSKMGNLMSDSTEVVDVNDVIKYSEQFDTKTKTNLVPFVIYMDSDFNKIVKAKKKRNILLLLFKVVGVLILILAVLYLLTKVIKQIKILFFLNNHIWD